MSVQEGTTLAMPNATRYSPVSGSVYSPAGSKGIRARHQTGGEPKGISALLELSVVTEPL